MEIHPLLVQLLHCCYCQTGFELILYTLLNQQSPGSQINVSSQTHIIKTYVKAGISCNFLLLNSNITELTLCLKNLRNNVSILSRIRP